jgi:hypothetical protein
MTGLPIIVTLAVLNGVIAAVNLAGIVHAADLRKQAAIAEANLVQAERKWMACHESGVYTVGEDVYVAQVKRSALNVRELPEVSGL